MLREGYDVCGNLLKRILPESYDRKSDDGAGYQYTYAACNRLVEIKNPLGIVEMRYVYGLRGNVTEIRVPMVEEEDGSVSYHLTTYEYDDMGNRTMKNCYMDY